MGICFGQGQIHGKIPSATSASLLVLWFEKFYPHKDIGNGKDIYQPEQNHLITEGKHPPSK